MSPQIACKRKGIVTLVAFIWFVSTMYFKMTSEAAFLRGRILTLVAFVRFFLLHYFRFSRGYLHWPHFHKTHHLSDCDPSQSIGKCCILLVPLSKLRKDCKLERENKWKWKTLLKTERLQDHPPPDQTITTGRQRQKCDDKDTKTKNTMGKWNDKNT